MSGKEIHFSTEARNKMLKGVNILADAVAVISSIDPIMGEVDR